MVTAGRKFTTFNNCKQFHYFISIITRRNMLNTLFLPYKICRIEELQGASPPSRPQGFVRDPLGASMRPRPLLKTDAPLSSNLGSTPANAKSIRNQQNDFLRIVTLFTNECPTYCISGPTDIAAIEKIGHWVTMVLKRLKSLYRIERTSCIQSKRRINQINGSISNEKGQNTHPIKRRRNNSKTCHP